MKDNLKIPRGPRACAAGQGRAFRPVSSETPSSTGSRTVFFLNMGESRRIPQLKLAGIRRFAAAKGWTVRAFPESESTISRVRALLRRERPLGCIVQYSSRRRTLPPELFAGVPAVWLECPPAFFGRGVPNACTDQTAVAREAFREIVSLRSAAVASVGYATSAFGPSWSDRRMAAFASLCEETGWPLHSFVYRGAMPQQGDRSPSSMRKLAAWIAALPRGTAVFAANDDLAAAVVDAAISAGRRIPADIKVIGVDDLDAVLPAAAVPLTSVQIDFERAGFMAARMLDAVIRGERVDPRGVTFGPLMTVRRRSTQGVRRAESNIADAIRIIRERACEGFCAAEVRRRIHGSRSLANLRFREATGHSIHNEILHVRLEKACSMLAGTDTPVMAIASFCGFRSSRTLADLFKRRFGMSMRAWRLANRFR